jgi:uncharacterized membrane protein YecN with MAPEG domain
MPSTPLFAAIFALIYIALAALVIRLRMSNQVSLGDGDLSELKRAVRVHGNFIEYVPISLILLWFVETISFSHGLAFVLGWILLVARILHIIGMLKPKSLFVLRQIGVIGTFAVLIIASVNLISHYLPIALMY